MQDLATLTFIGLAGAANALIYVDSIFACFLEGLLAGNAANGAWHRFHPTARNWFLAVKT